MLPIHDAHTGVTPLYVPGKVFDLLACFRRGETCKHTVTVVSTTAVACFKLGTIAPWRINQKTRQDLTA